MTDTEKKNILEARINKLKHNGKNVKSPGVLRKLKREVRK